MIFTTNSGIQFLPQYFSFKDRPIFGADINNILTFFTNSIRCFSQPMVKKNADIIYNNFIMIVLF